MDRSAMIHRAGRDARCARQRQLGRMFTIAARAWVTASTRSLRPGHADGGRLPICEVTAPTRISTRCEHSQRRRRRDLRVRERSERRGACPRWPRAGATFGAALYNRAAAGTREGVPVEREFPTVPFARATTLEELQDGVGAIGLARA
jgi:hypothetical protein